MNNFTIKNLPRGFDGELQYPNFLFCKNHRFNFEDYAPCVWVFGDACKDEWVYGSANRLNPESPCAILDLNKKNQSTSSYGMSANVFDNIISLTKTKESEYQIIPSNEIIFPYHVFLFSNQPEVLTKTRYIDKKSGQTLLRVDKGDKIEDVTISNSKWRSYLDASFPNISKIPKIIVISDYDKGFIDEEFLDELIVFAAQNKIIVIIDSKKTLFFEPSSFEYTPASYSNLIIKVNRQEYNKLNSHITKSASNIVVTEGEDGCTLYQYGKQVAKFPSKPAKVHNVCGAGDTFLAAMTVALMENDCKFEPEKILTFANDAAGIAVTYPNVVAVKREEVEVIRG